MIRVFLPPSILATVVKFAYVFNGDLNQWDVAKVTSMYASKSIRTVESDLTRLELLGGLGWWHYVCNLKNVAFFGLFECFDQGSSFSLLFLRVDCECNRPSFLATVFHAASIFNRNVNQWNVANVKNMGLSKSICIVENALT